MNGILLLSHRNVRRELNMLHKYKAVSNWDIVARNAVRWDALLSCFWIVVPCMCSFRVVLGGYEPMSYTIFG